MKSAMKMLLVAMLLVAFVSESWAQTIERSLTFRPMTAVPFGQKLVVEVVPSLPVTMDTLAIGANQPFLFNMVKGDSVWQVVVDVPATAVYDTLNFKWRCTAKTVGGKLYTQDEDFRVVFLPPQERNLFSRWVEFQAYTKLGLDSLRKTESLEIGYSKTLLFWSGRTDIIKLQYRLRDEKSWKSVKEAGKFEMAINVPDDDIHLEYRLVTKHGRYQDGNILLPVYYAPAPVPILKSVKVHTLGHSRWYFDARQDPTILIKAIDHVNPPAPVKGHVTLMDSKGVGYDLGMYTLTSGQWQSVKVDVHRPGEYALKFRATNASGVFQEVETNIKLVRESINEGWPYNVASLDRVGTIGYLFSERGTNLVRLSVGQRGSFYSVYNPSDFFGQLAVEFNDGQSSIRRAQAAIGGVVTDEGEAGIRLYGDYASRQTKVGFNYERWSWMLGAFYWNRNQIFNNVDDEYFERKFGYRYVSITKKSIDFGDAPNMGVQVGFRLHPAGSVLGFNFLYSYTGRTYPFSYYKPGYSSFYGKETLASRLTQAEVFFMRSLFGVRHTGRASLTRESFRGTKTVDRSWRAEAGPIAVEFANHGQGRGAEWLMELVRTF